MIFRRLIRLSIATVALAVVVFICLISASVYTFNVLTDETLIAEVHFERVGNQQYLARLRTGDGCDERELRVYGDQWRIDAEFLKWKYWALLLGLDSQYRLDRFEGRYRGIDAQNTQPTLAHELDADSAIDVVRLADALGPLNFLIDASYGSSTYQDIDTASVHRVYKTPTGIFTRSVATPAAPATADALEIEISRACGGGPGYWERIARWTDDAVVAVLKPSED